MDGDDPNEGSKPQGVPDCESDPERAARKAEGHGEVKDILYRVDDNPPWYLCILLGFQHFLTMFGSTFAVPIILHKQFCMADDKVALAELIGTTLFVSGLCTFIQSTFGVRLPIIQGCSFAFLTPTITLLSFHPCGYNNIPKDNWTSAGLPEVGSDEHKEMWQSRIRESYLTRGYTTVSLLVTINWWIQGCIMVASLFEVFIGFTGLIGFMLRYISPIVIAPTITLIGVSFFETAANKSATHWWISITTVVLITVFSQYLRNVSIPFPSFDCKKGCTQRRLQLLALFPVLLGIVVAWAICAILTGAGALTDDPKVWGYAARTDVNNEVLQESNWFRFPYPGQWGVPTVTVAGVFGILAGVLASMVESVGDYYACARLSGAPPPPVHAVNRGIGIEGLGCILAGAWGTGNGTTSYSQNVGAIGITKVGSRLVVQVAALIMLLLGCLGKFGAVFVTIPDPVLGGVFIVMFGFITSVGVSNLQHVDMNSSRNLFIFGLSTLFGLAFPFWLKKPGNASSVAVGHETVDQILYVLLGTSMFVGGVIAFILDVTIPGTDEERGILKWRVIDSASSVTDLDSDKMKIYDIPLIQPFLNKISCTKYLPFCPSFAGLCKLGRRREKRSAEAEHGQSINIAFEGKDTPTDF